MSDLTSSLERFAGGAAYVQGRFVPMAEATIPVTDWGFTRPMWSTKRGAHLWIAGSPRVPDASVDPSRTTNGTT